ncbi:hypothetical protein FB446DRAFT_448373 [Lentinula raphanica]|nr:hypothetical protein FB446DRAFT_448373 [Lentinula raphanica]
MQHSTSHLQEIYTRYLWQTDVLRICALCCTSCNDIFVSDLPVEKLVLLCSDAPGSLWKETVSWMESLSSWFSSYEKAQWMKTYSSEGSAEDHEALEESFVRHGLGEPWLLSIIMAMHNWAKPWYQNEELHLAAEAFRHTLEPESRDNPTEDKDNLNISRNVRWVRLRQMINMNDNFQPNWTKSRKSDSEQPEFLELDLHTHV